MKTDVHVGWKEFLKIVMSVVLVVSLVPICTTQNEQVAFASDASVQKNQVDANQEDEVEDQDGKKDFDEDFSKDGGDVQMENVADDNKREEEEKQEENDDFENDFDDNDDSEDSGDNF